MGKTAGGFMTATETKEVLSDVFLQAVCTVTITLVNLHGLTVLKIS